MKKQLLALSMVATAGLMADANMNPPAKNNTHAACCNQCQCNPCCCTNPRPCVDCECYVPAFGNLQCDWGFYLDVEFLYWYARENNLPIAAIDQGVVTFLPDTSANKTISILNFDAKWDPGVRAGIGWNMDCDGWDMYLNWTYFKNCSTLKKSVAPNLGFATLQEGEFGISSAFLAIGESGNGEHSNFSSKWTNRFNQVDLELGRKYWLSRCFVMRPFAGLRGAWTRTNIHVLGSLDSGEIGAQAPIIIQDSAKLKDRIWGVGLLAGFEPTWYFSTCFALYGDFSAALIWGETKTNRNGSIFFSDTGTTITDFNYSTGADFFTMSSLIDLGLGLRWEQTWCCDRYRTALDLGWEHHIWFSHAHRFVNTGSVGADAWYNVSDLCYGGLVVRVKWDF